MEKRKIQKIITYCAMLFLLTGILAGCGKKQEEDGMTYFHHSLAEQRETQTEEESTNEQEMYLISAVEHLRFLIVIIQNLFLTFKPYSKYER